LVAFVTLMVLNVLLSILYQENLQSVERELGGRLTIDFVQDIEPRREFYRIGWPQLSANPLGSGTGTSWIYMGTIETGFLDNAYLTAALKYGIPGLAILLWFWISPVLKCIHLRRFSSQLDIYTKGLLTAITAVIPVVLILNLNVAHLLYNRQTVVAMAIAMAWIERMYSFLLRQKYNRSNHSPRLL
jgi:O-antigen ligase